MFSIVRDTLTYTVVALVVFVTSWFKPSLVEKREITGNGTTINSVATGQCLGVGRQQQYRHKPQKQGDGKWTHFKKDSINRQRSSTSTPWSVSMTEISMFRNLNCFV